MSTFTGHAGVIQVGGNNVAEVRSFTIEQSQATIETTAMQASGDSTTSVNATYKAGPTSFTISGDLYFDGDDTNGQAALEGAMDAGGGSTGITFKVYPAGVGTTDGKAFEGNAIMTSFSVSSSVDGAVEASFSAQGTGALTMDDANTVDA